MWSKQINGKDFPFLPTVTRYDKYASVRAVSVTVNEMFAHVDTYLSSRRICASVMSRIPWFTLFIPEKT
jgi:hypothetical protein